MQKSDRGGRRGGTLVKKVGAVGSTKGLKRSWAMSRALQEKEVALPGS
jgi:hypothetical protein